MRWLSVALLQTGPHDLAALSEWVKKFAGAPAAVPHLPNFALIEHKGCSASERELASHSTGHGTNNTVTVIREEFEPALNCRSMRNTRASQEFRSRQTDKF